MFAIICNGYGKTGKSPRAILEKVSAVSEAIGSGGVSVLKHEQGGEQTSSGESDRPQTRSSKTIWEKVDKVSEAIGSGGWSVLNIAKRN
jgi:hypothetical protein